MACDGERRDRGRDRIETGHAFTLGREEDEREGGAPIVRDEGIVTGAGPGGDARGHTGASDRSIDRGEFLADTRRVDGGALG
jgi:hypothetical protein